MDAVVEVIKTLTDQSKIVLMSIIKTPSSNDTGSVTTGEVYTTYVELSKNLGYNPLSQRMVANLISEMDMLGIITARVKSFGRGGRTKEIDVNKVSNDVFSILSSDDIFRGMNLNQKLKKQTTLM